MISKLKFLILGVSCLLFQHEIIANNIVVSNVTLTGRDVTAGANNAANFTMVRFDITWENSWKTSSGPANYDAAWVFVKYRVGNGPWQHASLNNTGHTAGNTDATITTGLLTPGANFNSSTNPGLGVFISRNVDGIGTFTSTGNQLRWNYGANGVDDGANVDVKVFAIEMVYVPQGSFSLGSGGTETNSFTDGINYLPTASIVLNNGQPGSSVSVTSISLTNGGNGYTTAPTVTISASQGSGATATATISNGQVTGLTLVSGGSGYTTGNPPTVSFSPPPNIPLQITSENSPITIAAGQGNLWSFGSSSQLSTGTISSTYPKGFAGFFCMKYEISQQQYVDFLNTLTRAQQANRVGTTITAGTTAITNRYVMANNSIIVWRNGIRCDASVDANNPINFYCDFSNNGTGGESSDGLWIACDFLLWTDGAAYADWSGLRPMTELEFEKACRGTAAPIANEYVWGSTSLTKASLPFSNSGLTNEAPSNVPASGLSNYSNTGSGGGPYRVGSTATSSTNRIQSGSTFYGIMDMGGNAGERVVSAGNSQGRSFNGLHGDGTLSSNGHANQLNWPGLSSGDVTTPLGSGIRGGDFVNGDALMRISDRNSATNNSSSESRSANYGFRAVRSF
jgi:formylglycine-generating enzyme required for sulfatase activity